jgi:hypothetical protein
MRTSHVKGHANWNPPLSVVRKRPWPRGQSLPVSPAAQTAWGTGPKDVMVIAYLIVNPAHFQNQPLQALFRRLREQFLDRLIDDLFQFSIERIGDKADGAILEQDILPKNLC